MSRKVLMLLAAVCVFMWALPAAQAAEVEWKFFSYWQANDEPTKLHKAFAEDIEKASNGRFVIKVFSAGEMPYTMFDVLKIVARNQVQMVDIAWGSAAGDVPELNAFSMPFVCDSMEDFYEKAAPAVDGLINKTLHDKYKVQSLFQWVVGPQQMWLVKPAANLEGLKGLKVRAWNREQTELMRLLGGSGVTITAPEVIPALQRGVADGAFTAATPALGWKFYEVCTFAYMMNLSLAHQSTVYNEKEFEKLPKDLQELLVAKGKEWAGKYRESMTASDSSARKELAAQGMELRELTAEERDSLQKLVKPIWDEWISKNGDVAKSMLDAVLAATR